MWNSKTRLPLVYSYAIAIFLPLAALIISTLWWDFIKHAPLLVFIAAVIVAAWRGGLGPGLLCGILSILAIDFFLLEPTQFFSTDSVQAFLLLGFGMITILISVLQESRLRAEQSLLNIKEELEVILNTVTDGITAQDTKGQTLFANEAAALLTRQLSPSEMVKSPIEAMQQRFELFDERGDAFSMSQLPRFKVMAEGLPAQTQFKMRVKATGEESWMLVKSSPVFDKHGDIRLIVNVMRDVTERYRIQAMQKQTEDRLRKVLDTITTFVGVMSPDGTLIEVNRAALEVANLQPEDVIGKPFYETYWWSYSDESKQRLKDAIASAIKGETVQYNVRVRLSDLHYILIEFTLAPVFDQNGKIEYLIPSGIDVNERTRLSVLLVQEQKRMAAILNNIPGIVFEGTSVEGEVRPMNYISNYSEKMLGYPPEKWKNNDTFWKEIIHPEDWENTIQEAVEIYRSGKPGVVRFRCITRDGRVIYTEALITVLKNEAGEFIGTCGVIMDITEHKQLEDMLEAQAEDLKRSNKDLEQFAYVASHDLQEPLRMVTSYLQLIERRYADKLDDDGREFINFAVDGSSRMKRLINDLLTYSRVQRDASDYSHVDIQNIVDRVLGNLKLTIEDTGAIITHDTLPQITAHEGQLVQLFQNLIGNALKFRRDVPLEIHIGVQKQTNQWLFSIKDNGIGIEEGYKERIFVIFQRLHSHTAYSGTGIGLAICKKVVETHGGHIWMESTPGQGTTFYFTIPFSELHRFKGHEYNGSSRNLTR